MNMAPAPRFKDACGNEYLGVGLDDAPDLAGMLARLLDLIESPGVTEAWRSCWAPPGTSPSATTCHAGSASWYLIAATPGQPSEIESPSRDEPATACCPVCEATFVPLPNKRYCSALCRATAWRWRHANPRPAIPKPIRARSRRSRRSTSATPAAPASSGSSDASAASSCGGWAPEATARTACSLNY